MAGRMMWRRLGFLVAAVVAVFPALFQPLPAAAATSTGTLYGFAGPSNVVVVNPTTGGLTTVATIPFGLNVQGFGSDLANDPASHLLFIVQNVYVDQTVFPPVTASRIVTIDPKTHIVTNSPNLANSLVGLVFDTSSKTLIGLTNGNQLVHVDAATGVFTPLGFPLTGSRFSKMAVAPATHSLYLASISFATFPPTAVMLTVNTASGAISQSPPLNSQVPGLITGVVFLGYDTSSAALLGKTFCCPATLVQINPSTGAETVVKPGLALGSGFAVDPASNTIFLTDDEFGALGITQFILSINDKTGASSLSGVLPSNMYVGSLVFEPAPPPPPTGCDQHGQKSGDFQCEQSK